MHNDEKKYVGKKFEDTKGVIRIRKSKNDRQYNGQKKKDNNDRQNITQKTKDHELRTPLKTAVELRCQWFLLRCECL